MNTFPNGKILGSILGAAYFALVFITASLPSLAQDEGVTSFAAEEEPPAFATPDAAVDALKAALAADDLDDVARILGLNPAKIRADPDTMESYAKIRDGAAKLLKSDEFKDRFIVQIGEKLWPLPFPIKKTEDGKWAFDTFSGFEEIINRRVGENELETIETMRAYVDAQNEYGSADRDDDGVLEFAQLLISSEGQKDGLFWEGEGSPAGDFVQEAALEKAKAGEGYFGYRYRILRGQGDRVAGGAHDYVINGNMIAGFALIAWPVKYAETGVQTFMVSHHGIVYETDLGLATDQIVKYIERFDPDETWTVVED